MKSVILGLGSNKSTEKLTKVDILRGAVKELSSHFPHLRASAFYKTKPMYLVNQSDFLNMALYFEVPTEMKARTLLEITQEIEKKGGRNREKEIRNGPRTLDIDIEIFGDDAVNEEDLIVPHPRLCERAFVLIPALEVASENNEKLTSLFRSYLSKIPEDEKKTVLRLPLKIEV